MEWTKGRKVMAVIGGIAILFMIYGIVHFIIMNNQYNKVIEVIKARRLYKSGRNAY